MSRQDKQRQSELEPMRLAKATEKIEALGFDVERISDTEIHITTDKIQGNIVKYWPYSGWATGRDIKDGRGLNKLLRQLKELAK